jgi:hypothetical protein
MAVDVAAQLRMTGPNPGLNDSRAVVARSAKRRRRDQRDHQRRPSDDDNQQYACVTERPWLAYRQRPAFLLRHLPRQGADTLHELDTAVRSDQVDRGIDVALTIQRNGLSELSHFDSACLAERLQELPLLRFGSEQRAC